MIVSLRTHDYDGRIPRDRWPAAWLPPDRKRAAIDDLARRLAPFRDRWPRCLDALRLVALSTGTPANYDATNGVRADDLLAAIAEAAIEDDLLPALAEQLSDVVTGGSCAQGRCTRLAQILFACID